MSRSRQTFVFKVTLRHTKPAIWRRIEVPATYTFWDLHVAIQDGMGWLDYHLHQFHLEDRRTGAIAEIGIPDPDEPLIGRRAMPGWQVALSAYLSSPDVRIDYTYDFGDNWEQRVILEAIGIRDDRLACPRYLAGVRACPPRTAADPMPTPSCCRHSPIRNARALANSAAGRARRSTRPRLTRPASSSPIRTIVGAPRSVISSGGVGANVRQYPRPRRFIRGWPPPPRVLALVVEWATLPRQELLENWRRLHDDEPARRIAPLE